jgi:hypothetical protein
MATTNHTTETVSEAQQRERDDIDDDLWCWLAVAADRAEDIEVYRALDTNEEDQRHDEIRGHLERAHGHLSQARDLRRDNLLDAALDDYNPEDLQSDSK